MQPYQQRVITEKEDLDRKAKDLSEFISISPTFETLNQEEQERLKVQNDIMWQYSEVLGQRISAMENIEFAEAKVVHAMKLIDADPDDFGSVKGVVRRMIAAGYTATETCDPVCSN